MDHPVFTTPWHVIQCGARSRTNSAPFRQQGSSWPRRQPSRSRPLPWLLLRSLRDLKRFCKDQYLDWCQGFGGCRVAVPPRLDLSLRVGDTLGVVFGDQHPHRPDRCPNEKLQSHALAAQRCPSGASRASPIANALPLLWNAPPRLPEMSSD